MTFFSP